MKKSLKQLTHTAIYLLGVFASAFPCLAYAQPKLNQPAPGVGLTMNDFILWLIQIIQAVGTPLLVIAIIYAGFKFVTAQGKEDELSKAKVTILWTLVGAAIIISAQVIAGYIKNTASSL